jgi:hypothetical protein
MVHGLHVNVTEGTIVEATGLPQLGVIWFSKKASILAAKVNFLRGEEQVKEKGKGIDRTSLPPPWKDVSYFVQRYITCEGRFTIVFNYHFMLLSHLHHGKFLNIPYFLLESMKLMASSVHQSKHPQACVSNHGLIKLLVIHALEQKNGMWLEFITPAGTQGSMEEERNDTKKLGRG